MFKFIKKLNIWNDKKSKSKNTDSLVDNNDLNVDEETDTPAASLLFELGESGDFVVMIDIDEDKPKVLDHIPALLLLLGSGQLSEQIASAFELWAGDNIGRRVVVSNMVKDISKLSDSMLNATDNNLNTSKGVHAADIFNFKNHY